MEQLTLREVIDKLDSMDLMYDNDKVKNITFDFCMAYPTHVDSWRGSYSEPSIGFSFDESMNAKDFLNELKDSVGREVTGYKGGEFTLREDSYLWVDDYGRSTETGIFDVVDLGWKIIIRTTHFKY